ncbi:MAG: hypothetical protein JW954_02490 [Dehalococcoidaceae bacterium]|nr:hypothetical protein [Dehalococcoidaceae bacterium]
MMQVEKGETTSIWAFFIKCLIPLGLILLVAGSSSCSPGAYPIPVFKVAPETYSLERLLSDYEQDPAAAAARHEGKMYLFPSVDIDYVLSPSLTPLEYNLGGMPQFRSGPVVFKPQYLYDLDRLAPGFVVDVYGEVRGWIQKDFHIVNCTFAIAKGGDMPPPGAY